MHIEGRGSNSLGFLVNTYEIEIAKNKRDKPVHASAVDGDERRGPDRPRNTRLKYSPLHLKVKSVQQILRSRVHYSLPDFIG